MKVMVMVKATKESETGAPPDPEMLAAMGKYNEELIAGFWLGQVRSTEEAVEWLKKCPNPMMSSSDVDIRPLFEMEDYAEWDEKLGSNMTERRGKLADRQDRAAKD